MIGVGTASGTPERIHCEDIGRVSSISRTALSKRSAQSNAPSGLPSPYRRGCARRCRCPRRARRVAQGREPRTEVEVVVERLRGVDGQLDHGDVGVRKRMGEYRPRAVIDAPAVVIEPTQTGLTISDLLGEARRSRRRVLEVEQRLRKPVEVMDRSRRRHRGHRSGADVPVRGDRQDRARPGNRSAERRPCRGVSILLERVHRAAVSEEHRGHLLSAHSDPPLARAIVA